MLIVVAAVGCAGHAGSGAGDLDDELGARHAYGGEPVREAIPPARFAREHMVHYHMQRHFDDLQTIERMLVRGDLATAKALAFMLTLQVDDPGLTPWNTEARMTVGAARDLMAAQTVDEALRREARVAATCAACHRRADGWTITAQLGTPPIDQPTPAARMARHQWAADRLWEGMIAANDARWRAGLEVLAATPVPISHAVETPLYGPRLQATAKAALARGANATADDRTSTYGELLVTCAGCHRFLR